MELNHPGRGGLPTASADAPFRRAATLHKRLKLFLWGPPGAGKTTLGLQFPRPVVIDMEGGTDHYGGSFEFDVVRATTADEVMAHVDWLRTHPHEYCTLMIDPFTIYWDALQRKWSDIYLRRNKGSKGHRFEFYDLQPKDWMPIKAELKELIRKLIALDMNVIVTARQKPLYAESGFMQTVGDTFDGEKSLPYLFDTIVRLYRDPKGRFLGECLKDRTNKLPKDEFEISYQLFAKAYDAEILTRTATPLPRATDEQKRRIAEAARSLGVQDDYMATAYAKYGAASLDDLTIEAADELIDRLDTALANKAAVQPKKES
jgi:AAA domain